MVAEELLGQDHDFIEAERLQLKHSELIKQSQDSLNAIELSEIQTIMGVDISYYEKDGKDHGVACAVSWDLKKKTRLDAYFASAPMQFPYKAGFLGFREVPLIYKAIKKAPNMPDVIMCDGHGIIHPLRFGEAVHLGYILDLPTIGVAKNSFIGHSQWKSLLRKRGERTPIYLNDVESPSNEIIGCAICLADDKKPVFVSSGYKISLNAAIQISLATSFNQRQPEPLWLADKLSRQRIKEIQDAM